jgi:hypothetical protein
LKIDTIDKTDTGLSRSMNNRKGVCAIDTKKSGD